ncbi:hypothetical protein ACO2D6_000848 [Escherichia coli]|uniref:Uncharacterized protein n=2 Tax=Escherichia coli TaxID=562 RepID=A0A376KI15_ECOLX|nr:hypothetical protein [Escherichia coli]EEX7162387.1 hypothetical protein [Escherichia coli]EEY9440309.1 hypothetical protein [Escherichia coli]EEZ1436268.1 hypothetical protein [Escherichia coli]EFG6649517.1 hypothetical protein [Escherichia coli]EFL0438527.1 hypothetical protein [Escherichia coli]
MEFLRTALPFWALFLLTWVCVVYFFIYEEPRCPPWIYDVVKAITMFIVFVNIVVIPALALPGH